VAWDNSGPQRKKKKTYAETKATIQTGYSQPEEQHCNPTGYQFRDLLTSLHDNMLNQVSPKAHSMITDFTFAEFR